MTTTTITTPAWACDSCEYIAADEPEGPVYECSRCGQNMTDTNRCESCNIFCAKVGETMCPECGKIDTITEIDAFAAADGTLLRTTEDVAEWDEAAPVRERFMAESAERTRQLIDNYRAKNRARNAELLPRIAGAIELVDPDLAPKLHAVLVWSRDEMTRCDTSPGSPPFLYFPEVAALLCDPEIVAKFGAVANEYFGRSTDERRVAETVLRRSFMTYIEHPALVERLDRPDFTWGTGHGVDLDVFLDGFVPALERRAQAVSNAPR